MKKFLLPESGNFYKANLHCHTTISDGRRTPEEVKDAYLAKGYSIVAYTDHDVLVPQNHLTDENFVALNGYELGIPDESELTYGYLKKACHIGFISKDENNRNQPCFHHLEYLDRNENGDIRASLIKINADDEHEDATYSPEMINKIMKAVKEKGFYVIYNHPTWSMERYTDYINYDGMDAFEMFNGGSLKGGYEEYNPRVYDDLLISGKKIFCVGADDNHSRYIGTRMCDEGIAFTVIKAEELTYASVIKALEDGNFYASTGPEIYELYLEDGKVYVKCSDADRITISYGIRKAGIVCNDDYSPVNEATFVLPNDYDYFRITVVDENGRQACTNAYFMEDLI